jgi:hypothetical protein
MRSKLITIITRLYATEQAKLKKLKAQGESLRAKPDWLWHELLVSFSTWGNSRGWHGLVGNQENYRQICYEELDTLSDAERKQRLINVCRAAKIRMPDKKADYLNINFTKIRAKGGVVALGQSIMACQSEVEIFKQLKSFKGIGDKYARNMMMDLADPRFTHNIAIDHRINKVLEMMGVQGSYEEQEKYLLDLVSEMNIEGLDGWSLDRLMYWYLDEVVQAIHSQSKTQPSL